MKHAFRNNADLFKEHFSTFWPYWWKVLNCWLNIRSWATLINIMLALHGYIAWLVVLGGLSQIFIISNWWWVKYSSSLWAWLAQNWYTLDWLASQTGTLWLVSSHKLVLCHGTPLPTGTLCLSLYSSLCTSPSHSLTKCWLECPNLSLLPSLPRLLRRLGWHGSGWGHPGTACIALCLGSLDVEGQKLHLWPIETI